MVCRPSAPTRSGRCCTTRVGVGRRAGPGAIPAWSCANANGAWSWSATLMRGRKKADRAGLHAGITAGAVGLVRRRSWTVPGSAASRFQLAAEGPATQPHEYVRAGTAKILTLFHPASGQVQLHPVTRSTNAILHPWLKMTLEDVTARLPTITDPIDPGLNRPLWQVWQNGLTMPFSLPEVLPPLRVLLVWDNLAGHKTPEMVGWLCRHGIMPLYTPLGGSWLNMAEAIQRILKRRALDGQYPTSPAEIGTWFVQTAHAWNQRPTPFVWNGKRRKRRRNRPGDGHPVGGSAAFTLRPISHFSETNQNAEAHTK